MRRRSERGAAIVEFVVIAPVLFGVIGLALFLAHIYEVQSDVQHTAERTAVYGASKCDPRGRYADPKSGTPWPWAAACRSGADHPSHDDMAAYASSRLGQKATFDVASDAAACKHANAPVMCVIYGPPLGEGVTAPVPNHRMRVRLLFTYDTPLAPFMRLIGLQDNLVEMDGRGEATVE